MAPVTVSLRVTARGLRTAPAEGARTNELPTEEHPKKDWNKPEVICRNANYDSCQENRIQAPADRA